MDNRHKPLRTLVSASVLSILASNVANSAGFSLYGEGNGTSSGNFGAGSAAEAADASIGWYNPAGLVLLADQEVVFAGTGVFPKMTLSGNSTFTTTVPGLEIPDYVQTFSKLETSSQAFVPAFHYALPLTDKLAFGLSMVSPFGLATDWPKNSPVRYAATFSELVTMLVSPELGARLTENFSIGAGLDLEYSQVKFNSMLGAPTVLTLAGQVPTLVDSLSYNKGSSFGVGFHAGVMALFNADHTRLGLNYQSQINHTFHGFSRLTGKLAVGNSVDPANPNGVFVSNDLFSNEISLPNVVTLSAYHDLNQKFALLGSVVYTGWGIFKTIQLNNVAAPVVNSSLDLAQALMNITSPQNYRNTWRLALGANYHLNTKWMFRMGGGYDQTPTNDINRDVRLPDGDRYALSIGTHYQFRPSIGLDLGYTHFMGEGGRINRTDQLGALSTYNVTASTSATADLVGAQLVWVIDKKPLVVTK